MRIIPDVIVHILLEAAGSRHCLCLGEVCC